MSVFAQQLFKDKVALVTGGGTGIGLGIAKTLASLGANIAIASRKEENIAKGLEALKPFSTTITGHVMDIRHQERVSEVVEEIEQTLGPIDYLVNNAGGQFPQPLEDIKLKGWNAVIEVNLTGTFIVSQTVARFMRRRRRGAVVNIVANIVDRAAPGVAHSGAARAGVVNLTKSMAYEWAKYNIRVNAVGPGVIVTEGAEEEMLLVEGVLERFRKSIPMKRFGDVDDIGNAVVYFLSDAAKYVTGQVLMVDGGNGAGRGLNFLKEEF